MDASYPVAVRIEPASRMYNCHSYAWYNKSASNKYWMPYPWNAQKIGYMNDGSWTQLSYPKVDGRIFYYENGNEHSGVIWSVGTYVMVESKWGTCGVYYHSYEDCPYNASKVRYYI